MVTIFMNYDVYYINIEDDICLMNNMKKLPVDLIYIHNNGNNGEI